MWVYGYLIVIYLFRGTILLSVMIVVAAIFPFDILDIIMSNTVIIGSCLIRRVITFIVTSLAIMTIASIITLPIATHITIKVLRRSGFF